MLSIIAGAQYSLGGSRVFDFNGAKYNIRVCLGLDLFFDFNMYNHDIGGILPAAPGSSGSTNPVSDSNTGLAFASGLVPINLSVNFMEGHTIKGLNQSSKLH